MSYTSESEQLLTDNKIKRNASKKKAIISTVIFISVLICIGVATALIIIFTSPATHKWTTILQCRQNTSTTEEPEQMATLFYDKATKILYAGGGSDINQKVVPTLYRSLDQGKTWSVSLRTDSDHFSMYGTNKLDDGTVLVISSDDLYQSKDNGVTWSKTAGMSNLGFSMAYNDSVLMLSRVDGTIYRSVDNAKTFEIVTYIDQLGQNQINMRCQTYSGSGNFYFGISYTDVATATNQHAQIYQSTDYGKSYKLIFDKVSSIFDDTVFSIKAVNNNIILAGTGAPNGDDTKIFRSTDSGKTWTQIIDFIQLDSSLRVVRSFYIAANQTIYAAVDCSYSSNDIFDDTPNTNKNSAIYYSLDQGLSWKLHSKTNTKRLYWVTEAENQVLIASSGEFGQILRYE
ncbi:Conserved_hypothetical protein [Hexamita inflata]|uniref:Sortilin N-terminal domain-containing protein n=1 Tax=Hexamita inflata TaxID=28002 RepID=A0AA86QKL2_9EUKA|nr:Conserved hypothetical protein [Hexamita inflata]